MKTAAKKVNDVTVYKKPFGIWRRWPFTGSRGWSVESARHYCIAKHLTKEEALTIKKILTKAYRNLKFLKQGGREV